MFIQLSPFPTQSLMPRSHCSSRVTSCLTPPTSSDSSVPRPLRVSSYLQEEEEPAVVKKEEEGLVVVEEVKEDEVKEEVVVVEGEI
ncbi:unnamed protein product [Boreogadus saida]